MEGYRQTDRHVLIDRPDITIKNKTDKIFLLTDVEMPLDKAVKQKMAEKKLKYKNLSIEIQRMWNMKCFFIPATFGATGIVTKDYKNVWKRQ
jgi:hypothetical protein